MAFLQNEQKQVQTQRLDPKVFLTQRLLQLNVQERLQSIENELLENPALELTEYLESAGDGGDRPYTADGEAARTDLKERADPFLSLQDSENSLASHQTPIELRDHLTNQLHLLPLSPKEQRVADYLIGNLDDNGLLTEPIQSIAHDLKVPLETVEKVLAKLQTLDPPGIAARSLQECLILQIQHLLPDTPPSTTAWETAQTAYRILKECFDDFVSHRHHRICRRLLLPRKTVQAAVDFITNRLTPYPAARFGTLWSRPFGEAVIRPDVIIHRTETGFQIEIAGYAPEHLRISPMWQEAFEKYQGVRVEAEEINHVREYVRRASLFIECLRNCHKILRAITRELILYQTAFIETGQVQFLRPLTRNTLAEKLGVHPSVVSRATFNKYVRLPNLEIHPFDIFFDYSLVVKTALQQIIAEEDPKAPFTDNELTVKLCAMGFDVARRTVVKYREQCRILPSHLRRRYN
ncbi:RNA polymerase, sigma 54 subunit, RpoN/SigL [Chthonomonas calidirosea]|uniref:RNA polymerase, sigma 54 subunit, RpoN/SigL n=1 Tax=Chthonomonas calidirosea (strain DSM 23976 / ICMP 18418 / T49) TaxID=1303518 RepID=S0EU72_CHTCT|nr:RNA polymerase sigma 54 subunit RpoN/SigL [Chthonomonas calidirosea]CCW34824.1 RNA polymerase, sigma 54 subunit, RpoN/SigL [Chthonomonas calidirosea T49]CEK13690.1 RNA polymerase, sigma 54 subunit, RpoN/SigL [Chthonomonas calidirosea]